MSWITAGIDAVADISQYWNTKFRTPRKAPPHVAAELDSPLGVDVSMWQSWDEEKKQRMAAKISWIYSNIVRIGSDISSAEFNVVEKGTKEKDIDHPFERLLAKPNEFFSGKSLLRYLIWGLSLDEWGAFWYLAPDSRNRNVIREIWPIPVGRMEPHKHKTGFIDYYLYKPKSSGGKAIRYDPKYIVRFFYPHPFDLWKSFTPLAASELSMSAYEGIATAQNDLYVQGRGAPLSILSLDPNISDPDFAVQRQRIRDDWESERKIAIVRAGSLSVQTVGLTSQQLQIVEALEYNRDEIDAIFMNGIQWRRNGIGSDEREELNKEIKESVIFPLHQLIADQIQIQALSRFYGEEYEGFFDDVRAQDRAMQVQERTIYWRGKTFDEARADLNLPPMEDKLVINDIEISGLGKLPFQLATNPGFIAKMSGIDSRVVEEEQQQVGNMEDSLDPEALVGRLADEATSVDLKAAIVDGMAEELKRYKKVLLRTWRKDEDATKLSERAFDTNIIPAHIMKSISDELAVVQSEENINEIFDYWLS